MILLGLNLYLISTTRISACIHSCGFQGILLAALPLTLGHSFNSLSGGHFWHVLLVSLGTVVFKGIAIPMLLLRAMRKTGIRREFEPFLSLHLSQLVGAGLVILSFWMSSVMKSIIPLVNSLALATGLSTLLIGIYLTINRKKSLSQVLGYLIAENGLFVMGWSLLGGASLLVELGVLLDILIAMMLMALLVTRMDEMSAAGETEKEPKLTGDNF